MKVIYIEGVKVGDIGLKQIARVEITAGIEHTIIEGETYTVVRTEDTKWGQYYQLEEKPPKTIYNARRFAPLSSIDETTFERNYNRQPA